VSAAISLLGDDRIVRYVGDPIAAVAAKDRKTAIAAIAAIRLTSEAAAIGDRPGRSAQSRRAGGVRKIEPQESRQRLRRRGLAGAVERQRPRAVRGVFAQGKKGAELDRRPREKAGNPLLVEATFRTGTQSHACLEPHAAVARFDGDRLTVHVSTQAVFHLMELIAKRYKLGHDKVRVIADHVGGGFGSKASLGIETIAAIDLARAAKAPVRIAFRPARRTFRHRLSAGGGDQDRAAALPEGDLKALSLTAYADTGAATNSTIAALARLIYPAEAKELADFDVISNLPPGAPFRGPGGPPMAFALEQAIDEAALRMKVDPIALRKRWDPNPNRQRLYDWASGLDVWRGVKPAAAQTGRYRRGVGVATGYWLYLWQPGSKVELAVKGGRLSQHRDAGYRHRQPHRDRQYGRAGIRAGAARDRGADRRFQSAGRTGLGRQPHHGLGRPADAARGAKAQSRHRAHASGRRPAPTRRGAS
jgi:xanthine dehydrogenase YagR molybdenum-binding subunit